MKFSPYFKAVLEKCEQLCRCADETIPKTTKAQLLVGKPALRSMYTRFLASKNHKGAVPAHITDVRRFAWMLTPQERNEVDTFCVNFAKAKKRDLNGNIKAAIVDLKSGQPSGSSSSSSSKAALPIQDAKSRVEPSKVAKKDAEKEKSISEKKQHILSQFLKKKQV